MGQDFDGRRGGQKDRMDWREHDDEEEEEEQQEEVEEQEAEAEGGNQSVVAPV